MAYLNKCMFIGNVGREPQIRTTNNGSKVANFSIAVSKRYKDGNGESKEKTDWIPCVVFGKLAGVVENLVTKGTQIFIDGEMSVSTYTDGEGNKKVNTNINILSIQVLSPLKRNNVNDDEGIDEELGF